MFPIGLSNGPRPGSKTPDGRNGLAEVAANGVNLVRTGHVIPRRPALFAWKAYDEPRNPARGADWIRPAGLVRAYKRIKALDAKHPVESET